MKNEEELIQRWTALLKGNTPFVVGVVKEVTGNTCKVLPLGSEVEIHGVKISFDTSANTVFTPAVDSVVVIGKQRINKMQKEYFIVQCTKVETVKIHGETFGGLVKVGALVNRLNIVENKLKDVIDKWNSFAHDYAPGSPATTGSPATLTSLTTIDNTEISDIENPKVKHG